MLTFFKTPKLQPMYLKDTEKFNMENLFMNDTN
jgi:hypothetical protein